MGGNGRYFFEGSFNMAASLGSVDATSPRFVAEVSGSSLVCADWWRVCVLRLGRKKQERTKQRRGCAAWGLARLFVAIHGGEATTEAGGRQLPASIVLGGFEQRDHQRVHGCLECRACGPAARSRRCARRTPWAGRRRGRRTSSCRQSREPRLCPLDDLVGNRILERGALGAAHRDALAHECRA